MRRLALCVLVGGCGFRAGHALALDGSGSPDVAGDAIPADWWNPAWHHRQKLQLDNSKVTAALPAFPVLVTLNRSNFDFAGARPDGADLRFVAADGTTVLAYDLDTWSTTGTSWLWVAIDIPAAPAPAPYAWLYDGNPSASAGASPGAVWSTFVSVHHLVDFSDASGHEPAGTPVSTTPVLASGMIGGARTFNGASDAIALPIRSAYNFTNAMSLSLWAHNVSFTSNWECFVCKGDLSWRLARDNGNHVPDFGSTSSAANDNLAATGIVDDGGWHHIAIWFSGGTKAISVDGGPKQTSTVGNFDVTTDGVLIGQNANPQSPPANRWFSGDLDEVRISGAPRDAAWFAAEYHTVHDATFAQLGAEQTIP